MYGRIPAPGHQRRAGCPSSSRPPRPASAHARSADGAAGMDAYRRLPRAPPELSDSDGDGEGGGEGSAARRVTVRVTASGALRSYAAFALGALGGGGGEGDERGGVVREVRVRAAGRAVSKAVTLAEVLKRRVAGLHQITECSTKAMREEFEPVVEGLANVTQTRQVSVISIRLSLDPLDAAHAGYQPPLAAEHVRADAGLEGIDEGGRPNERRSRGQRSKGGRAGGRGGRGGGGSGGSGGGGSGGGGSKRRRRRQRGTGEA